MTDKPDNAAIAKSLRRTYKRLRQLGYAEMAESLIPAIDALETAVWQPIDTVPKKAKP